MIEAKNILVVSPQSWNSRKVSKHNYSIEFAKSSTVYYLDPPDYSLFGSNIKFNKIANNLTHISYKLPIPRFFKFKFERIYRFFLVRYLKKIKKRLGQIDYLWNFDNGTYFKEEWLFNESFKIFHPVDDFEISEGFNYTSYDIGFSVSPEILNKIPLKKKIFINHGVSELNCSTKPNHLKSKKNKPKKAVYVGNLSIRFLDTFSLKKIIQLNNDIEFNFIGDFEIETQFIKFLNTQENVNLLGPMNGKELNEKISNADILLLCYKQQPGYFGDNSHKVLQYLSSGNVIVSSMLSVYKNLDLFPMSQNLANNDYVELFNKVRSNFKSYNTQEIRNRRINFAKENTYSEQLIKIKKYLHESV